MTEPDRIRMWKAVVLGAAAARRLEALSPEEYADVDAAVEAGHTHGDAAGASAQDGIEPGTDGHTHAPGTPEHQHSTGEDACERSC